MQISDFGFRLQIRIADSDYRFRLPIPIADSDCRFRLPIQIAGSDCRFRLQIPIADSDCRFGLPIAIADSDYRLRISDFSDPLSIRFFGNRGCLEDLFYGSKRYDPVVDLKSEYESAI